MQVTEVKLILSKYQHKLLDFAAKKHGGLDQLKASIHRSLIADVLTKTERERTQKMLEDVENLIHMINGMSGAPTESLVALDSVKKGLS